MPEDRKVREHRMEAGEDDSQPEAHSLSTTPSRRLSSIPLKVKKAQSACSFCKVRKIRCDGQLPSYSGCRRYGCDSTCSLKEDGHGPERNYVTYLQASIKRLQLALNKDTTTEASQQSQQQQHTRNGRTAPPPPAAQINQGQDHGSIWSPPEQPKSRIDRLVSEIGALPILASSYNTSYSDGLHLLTIVLAAASESARLPPVIDFNQQVEMRALLPNLGTAEKLANHYCDHLYPRLPIFSIQGFWTQFRLAYQGLRGGGIFHGSGNVDTLVASVSPSLDHPSGCDADDGLSNTSLGYTYFTVLVAFAISIASLSRGIDSVISQLVIDNSASLLYSNRTLELLRRLF